MKLRSVGRSGLVVAGFLFLGACGSDPPEAAPAAPSTAVASQDVAVETEAARSVSVKIIDTDFMPVDITIEKGSVVDWVQVGDQPHSVTAADGSFDSSPDCGPVDSDKCLGEGDTFSHVFETAGEFTYYCRVHGLPDGTGMVGTIIIE